MIRQFCIYCKYFQYNDNIGLCWKYLLQNVANVEEISDSYLSYLLRNFNIAEIVLLLALHRRNIYYQH